MSKISLFFFITLKFTRIVQFEQVLVLKIRFEITRGDVLNLQRISFKFQTNLEYEIAAVSIFSECFTISQPCQKFAINSVFSRVISFFGFKLQHTTLGLIGRLDRR